MFGFDDVMIIVLMKCELIEKEWVDLKLVWKVVKNVKFNVIVFVKDDMIIGVGVG